MSHVGDGRVSRSRVVTSNGIMPRAEFARIVNELFVSLGIEAWKPVLTALVLPPMPLLLLVLIGARVLRARRGLGWLLLLLAVAGLWATSSVAVAEAVGQWLLRPPPALSPVQVEELRERVKAKQPVAIVVLGGGQESRAPEYGTSNLSPVSLERLRYGLWLSRETGAPVAFSGGSGWAREDGPAEAQIAARIAQRDFNRPLRWTEEDSRDTRENALRTVALLKKDGIREIVLVSHGTHLPRAMRSFERAAAGEMKITPAPMGLARREERPALRWLPGADGFVLMRRTLHELMGLAMGA